MRKWRRKQREDHATLEAVFKAYARAVLPNLSNWKLNALEVQKVLDDKTSELLARLRDRTMASGISMRGSVGAR